MPADYYFPEDSTIKGRVVDQNGNVIIGANPVGALRQTDIVVLSNHHDVTGLAGAGRLNFFYIFVKLADGFKHRACLKGTAWSTRIGEDGAMGCH